MEMVMTPNDENILQVFGDDHERMRKALQLAIKACTQSARCDVRASFRGFADALRRHIRVEDEVLFPTFEAHTGLRDIGPTAVMRREHREIERRLDQIDGELSGLEADLETDLQLVQGQLLALQALLTDHDRREEMVLYPACDRFFTPRERFSSVHVLGDGWRSRADQHRHGDAGQPARGG